MKVHVAQAESCRNKRGSRSVGLESCLNMAKPPMGEENDEYEDQAQFIIAVSERYKMALTSLLRLMHAEGDQLGQVAETISLIEELHGTAKFKPLTPMTSSFRQCPHGV